MCATQIIRLQKWNQKPINNYQSVLDAMAQVEQKNLNLLFQRYRFPSTCWKVSLSFKYTDIYGQQMKSFSIKKKQKIGKNTWKLMQMEKFH